MPGRGSRGYRPAQEELEAFEREQGRGPPSEDSEEDSDEEEIVRKPKSAVEGLIETANPNEKQVKHAMKVSDLTGEQVEITGAAKRLLAEQAEKEQEMVAVQNGTNEEGAANLERLAEVRQRRAEAAAKRAEETAAKEAARAALREERGESWGGGGGAEPEPEPEPEPSEGKKKKKKKSKKGKKGDKADRPTIAIPPPKEMKGALIKLQGIASDDFLKRHTLKKASGNKLAKMKRAEFEKILADFQDTADVDELKEFME